MPHLVPVAAVCVDADEPLRPTFEQLYARHAAYTWRSLCHLGVEAAVIEDKVQELWVIVHRRLGEYEARSEVKTWLFGIAINVARNHRRAERRKPARAPLSALSGLADSRGREERMEAYALVHGFLRTLDERRCEVFVSALLEGMSASETAKATGLDVDKVQNLVRALRRTFKAWLMRHGGAE